MRQLLGTEGRWPLGCVSLSSVSSVRLPDVIGSGPVEGERSRRFAWHPNAQQLGEWRWCMNPRSPTYHPFYWDLGLALAGLGRHEEAVATLRQATHLAPEDPVSQGYLGWVLGLAKQQEALAIRTNLE